MGGYSGKSNAGFSDGGFSCSDRFVLRPDVAIACEVSIFSKNSLAITDFLAKRTQLANNFGKPPSWNTPIHDFLDITENSKIEVSVAGKFSMFGEGCFLSV